MIKLYWALDSICVVGFGIASGHHLMGLKFGRK